MLRRPPVVLLHALFQDASMWAPQGKILRRRGYQVIAPDQRGFGAVPVGGAPPSLEVLAEDLAHALDARGVGEAVLAGSSMGGYLAMEFLRRYRHRVLGLALLGTRAGPDTAGATAERRRFAELLADDRSQPRLLRATAARLVGATTRKRRPELVARLGAQAAAMAPESLIWAQRAVAGRTDSFPLLRAAEVPAVVLAGMEDELVPLAEARELSGALPLGRLVTVPESGHLIPVEAPRVVGAALVELLEEVGATC